MTKLRCECKKNKGILKVLYRNNPKKLKELGIETNGKGLLKNRGGEDDASDDSFLSTTSASFSVDLAIGAVDGNANSEAVGTAYSYQIDLSTSFTGEDSLDVAIVAGSGTSALSELDLYSTADALIVDGISYTFPLGDNATVSVGDSVNASSLYNTACVYGGFTNTLDDCGNPNTDIEKKKPEIGGNALSALSASPASSRSTDDTALSVSYNIGGGFTAALGYGGPGTTSGLMNKDAKDTYGAQIAYAGDNCGISLSYTNKESNDDTEHAAINVYYAFAYSSSPSISLGYEMGSSDAKDTSQYFAGVQWNDVRGVAIGVAAGSNGSIIEGATQKMAYEAFLDYSVTDNLTITPAVFYKEDKDGGDDQTGFAVKTSFGF